MTVKYYFGWMNIVIEQSLFNQEAGQMLNPFVPRLLV